MGFSDLTGLINAVAQETHMITFHGFVCVAQPLDFPQRISIALLVELSILDLVE